MNGLDQARAALSDDDPRRRIEALRLLAAHGGPACIADILVLRHDPDPFVRGTVCQALGMLGEGVAPDMLFPALHDPDARTRGQATYAIEACGLRSTAAVLIPMLADPEPMVRIQVAQVLAVWSQADALAAIEGRIALERRAEVRAALFHARLRLPDPRHYALLLRDEHWETQHGVLRSMAHSGLSGCADMLAHFLRSAHDGVRHAAAAALADGECPDSGLLLACCEAGEPELVAGVLAALVDHAQPDLLALARTMMLRTDARALVAAVRYIGRHGDDADIGLLKRFAHGKPSAVLDAARLALAQLEGTAEVPDVEPFPSGQAAVAVIRQLADSGEAGQRSRAGMIAIANGWVGAEESLAILDRARARGDAIAACVVLALSLQPGSALASAMRRALHPEPISRWEHLADFVGKLGLVWTGPIQGRLTQPLHSGGEVTAQTVLLRLAAATAARAICWRADAIGAARVWQAVEQARLRLAAGDFR
jgi:HEAT repeat protein